jgi:signal peptidase I
MNPTLYGAGNDGDVLIANRLKTPKHGDIVIIAGVEDYWLIKRVIACEEGDTIEIKNGLIKINGKIFDEDYVKNGVSAKQDEVGQWVLNEGEVFYLGDNRENSSDSRTYGACKDENVIGVVEEWSLKNRKLRSQFLKYIDRIKSVFN